MVYYLGQISYELSAHQTIHRGAEQDLGFNELNQEVWHCPGQKGHCGNHPQCAVKSQSSGFLKKIIFLIFWSSKRPFLKVFWGPNEFFWPPYYYWPLNWWFRGGQFSSNYWFEKIFVACFFKKLLKKPKLRSRIIGSMNPKTISLEANNGMGVKKIH